MYLIVGLGNPGRNYVDTRHNVGFMTIDRIANKHNIEVIKSKHNALIGEGSINGERVILMKPMTFMNESGRAIIDCVRFLKIPIDNIIVICDDIDIPFGTVRVKKKGSAGTHNGLKSIINHTKDQNFPRIKISVGKKPAYMDLANFVLSRFSNDEKKVLDLQIDDAVEATELIIKSGVDEAMNKLNGVNHLA
ncbi:MAG: aminoacyl-tRNA hydrolase [Tissierellia bacterium]|nr:aminoacyl-tRNA hydrolase [Tissierellia bacterium]